MELIEKCKKNCLAVEKDLKQIESCIIMGCQYDYRDALKHSEQLAVQVRELCSDLELPDSLDMFNRVKNKIIVECSGIKWDYINEDHFVLHLPALLKKNRFSSRDFFYTEVMNVLFEICQKYTLKKGKGRVVVFDHHVNSHNKRNSLDYDNLDISIVINCLAEMIIGNDSPFCYHLFHTATIENEPNVQNRVDVHVLSKEEFVIFVLGRFLR